MPQVSPLETIGRTSIVCGVVASTWTSVTVAGQMIADLLLFGGAVLAFLGAERPLLAHRRSRLSLTPLSISAWLVLIGTALLVASNHGSFEDFGIAIRVLVSLIGVPLAALTFLRDRGDGVTLVLAGLVSLSISGAVCVANAVLGLALTPMQQQWDISHPFSTERAVAFTNHPNILGYASASLLPSAVTVWGLLRQRVGLPRLVILMLGGLSALLLSGSRGGALGVIFGVMVGVAVTGGRKALRSVAISSIVIGVLALSFPNSPLTQRLLGSTDSVASDDQRRQGIISALRQLADRFPGGTGLANVYDIHSGLLALLVSGGLVVFVGVLVWGGLALRSLRRGLRSSEPVLRQTVRGCAAGGAGALAYLMTSPFMYHRYALIAPGVAIAMVSSRRCTLAIPPSETPTEKVTSRPIGNGI